MALVFFAAAEVDISQAQSLRNIVKRIRLYFSKARQFRIADDTTVDIAFIPTLLKPGMFDSYEEVRRVNKQKNQVELRPRLNFEDYLAANEAEREQLVLKRLYELTELVEELDLSSATLEDVNRFISDCSI